MARGHGIDSDLFPSTRVSGRGPGWYRGDCHVHSDISKGGELSQEEVFAEAGAAGLDFFATTEHNTAQGHGGWPRHLDEEELLVILGQEATTPAGHWLALGVEPGHVVGWDYGVGEASLDRELEAVHQVGGLCVVAHPFAPYPSGTFRYPYLGFDAFEVWNGPWSSDVPWQADNEAALAMWAESLTSDLTHGEWRPIVGNSDAHLPGQIGVPHTVVMAHELSTEAILSGLRAGRSWVAASAEIELSFTVSVSDAVAEIGQAIALGNAQSEVAVRVRAVPSGTISLHTSRGPIRSARLPRHGAGTLTWHGAGPDETQFVRVEVRNELGQMAALTNPILLTR